MADQNKITRNSFSGGRDSDTNVAVLAPDRYREAHNIDFVANGNFFSLQNLQGTTKLVEIANDATIREIGSYPCKFSINGTLTYCILYFTMSSNTGTFNIWMFDTQNVVLYALYQETYGAGYYTADRVVDIVNYPENGVDHVYFTDSYNELRHLTCSITTPWTPNSLSAYDLALQRRGANGTISLSTVTTGGSLLTGTYQFAYRMCNPTAKKFTKWSSISDPVHVYDSDNSSNSVYAGIGLPSNRKITVTVTPSAQEIAALNVLPYVQLAVIENIGATPAITVSYQQFVTFVGTSMNIDYLSNTRIQSVPLDSFLIDPAQILNAKSLRSANNRLFIGNVNYVNLLFDSPFGNPAVSAGTIINATSATIGSTQGDSFSSDLFASKYVGHFRDEVYRYGAVYKDKYGNRSYVSPLDMTLVVDNQISGALDMHFPDRSFNKKYTLFNSNGSTQSLGLNLTLVNHPSWAVEVEIVRVPRKKNIMFQTPIIPMQKVYGIGALKNYPSTFTSVTGTQNFFGISYPITGSATQAAQPMTADYTYVPKNLFIPESRSIAKYTADNAAKLSNNGEVYIDRTPAACNYSFSMMFPTPNMYGDNVIINGQSNTFIYTGTEKINFVDQALLKLHYDPFGSGKSPYVIGEDKNTNISGNFYAVLDGDYFFDSAWAAKSLSNAFYNGTPLTGYHFYDNLSQTAPVSGTSVMDYDSLNTKGFKFGFEPNIQRSAVAALGLPTAPAVTDPTFVGSTFRNGVLNSIGSGGGFIIGASGARYQTNTAFDNSYLPESTTYNLSNDSYCTAVDIVNVVLGLGDNRYGDINSLLTYQSTGAVHTFTASEQATLQSGGQVTVNLDVWGGDCFVSAHTFKVADSAYSITNFVKFFQHGAETNVVLSNKWGGYYLNDYSTALSMPVAVENASQFVTVVLESEYNGGARDRDIVPKATSSNGFPIIDNLLVSTCRVPLGYRYNYNLSRGNYQKVFSTFLSFSFYQYAYQARVAYSNIKVYDSDISGFDVFNDADFYDLPEQRYAITSLAIAGDNLYAIQEKGVVYLPTSSRQVEQSDGSILAINTGDVIGRPIIVSSERGSQHLRGIVETGNFVFIPDNKNKDVYVLAGTEMKSITDNNQTLMRTVFSSQLSGNQVKGTFDFIRNQYHLMVPGTVQIFNLDKNLWTGDYEITPTSGTFQRAPYYAGFDGATNRLSIYSVYTGTPNTLLGNTVVPRVVFHVNPDEAVSKTFDTCMVDTSDQLLNADLQVIYDGSSNPSFINGLNLAVPNIENNYRIPFGFDQNGYRLRGMRMVATVRWGSTLAQFKSFYTKYRLSRRTPF